MIAIDTEQIKTMVAACVTTTEAITDAVDVLSRITSHGDWCCKEKDAIDRYTTENKNQIRKLQEDAQSFLQAVRGVSDEFEGAESSIAKLLAEMDDALRAFMQIPTTVGGPKQDITASIVSDTIRGRATYAAASNLLQSFATQTMCEPLSVCAFEDLSFQGEG